MKHFAAREFALLCSPLLIIALVGWLLAKRQAPLPVQPLQWAFHVEKPTVLEAFKGADAALVIELQGPQAGAVSVFRSDPWLEVQAAHRTQRSYISRGYSGLWTKVWKGIENGTRFPINSHEIPPGALRFGLNARLASTGAVPSLPKFLNVGGAWSINRQRIQPFPFGKMSPSPLVKLRSVKISRVVRSTGLTEVTGECFFDLSGTTMNAQTPVEFDFSGGGYSGSTTFSVGWGTINKSGATPGTMRWRRREWTIYANTAFSKSPQTIGRVTGRASADNRWPLAFQIEPFDLAKVKAGQYLHFKSWPAPVPTR